MDAGTRIMRSALALGLLNLAAGCSLRSSIIDPIARLQAPDDDTPEPQGPPLGAGAGPVTVSPPGEPVLQTAALALAEQATPQVRVVAVIGSDVFITDDEVWQLVRQRVVGVYSDPNFVPLTADGQKALEQKFFAEELKNLIEREIVLSDWVAKIKKNKPQAVDELKAEAEAMAKRTFREFRLSNREPDEAKFQEKLAKSGLSYKLFLHQLERNAMLTMYMNSYLKDKGEGISARDIRQYYDEHPEEFRSEEKLKWLDLFVSYRRFNTEADARAFALWLHKQAVDPATDFAALVKQHGHGTSPLSGGVGIGSKLAEVQPAELIPTLRTLKAGQVSAVVPGDGGLHIVKVAEFQPAEVPPFDEKVQDFIRRKLTNDIRERERQKLVETLKSRTTVAVYPENR